jgi:putative FmdB family regulatory protein
MPLFEYRCRSCGHEFEKLVRPHVPETLNCPECQSDSLERLLSAFAVDSEAGRQKNLAQGRAHAKRANRDKQVAEAEHIREHVMGHDHSH